MRARRRNGGFAFFIVIGALTLAAMSLMAMSLMTRSGFRRTETAYEQAQLRELLLAGASEARRAVEAGDLPAAPLELPLPGELSDDHPASVTIRFTAGADAGTHSAHVVATLGDAEARQTIVFSSVNETTAIAATIDRHH